MNRDNGIALVFLMLTVGFISAMTFSTSFFNWIFERHQNQWSWYIRPLFLLPFCYFAYRRSWSGMSVTIFALITSMGWFNTPEHVSENVKAFLQFEKDWLTSSWNLEKILLLATVPLSFFLLGMACWRRSMLMGLAVVVLMATGKIAWSVYNAGDAGLSIMVPAILGLLICTTLIVLGFKRAAGKSG